MKSLSIVLKSLIRFHLLLYVSPVYESATKPTLRTLDVFQNGGVQNLRRTRVAQMKEEDNMLNHYTEQSLSISYQDGQESACVNRVPDDSVSAPGK